MFKLKYVLLGLGAILLLAGGGFWWWHSHSQHQKAVKRSKVQPGSLLQASDSGSNLRVTSGSGASDLGPLTAGQAAGSSDQPKADATSLNPATFSTYDKYKDGQEALFAELQVGTGAELTAGKKAAVIYKAWLTNGQQFDYSKTDDKGQPQPFLLTLGAHEVIIGFEEGIAGMKVGGTRLVIIPPAVGYGPDGKESIPGNAVLVFEVQLVTVQ